MTPRFKKRLYSCALMTALTVVGALNVSAQTVPDSSALEPQPSPTPQAAASPHKNNLFINVLGDQRAIWLSGFNLQKDDAKWLAPLGLSFAALVATDRHTSGKLVEHGENLSRIRISKGVSHFGSFYATGAASATLYVLGRTRKNDRMRETGKVAAEALINSAIVVQALKLVSQRQRPPIDDSSGEFFEGGRSFPSGHAMSAWSFAAVIAHEYGKDRPLVRLGAYGVATVVSLSRFTGGNHFLSDVLVGSALGYGIGRYVYHERHDRSLDSLNKETRSSRSRLFPRLEPLYEPRARAYGVTIV